MTSRYDELLNRPELFGALFNQARGIPSAGRSLYQRWLAGQAQRSATNYILSQTPGVGSPSSLSYRDYLAANPDVGPTNSAYFDNIMAMDPQAQRATLENLPDYVRTNLIGGAFRNQGIPNFLADSLTQQAFAREPAFQISEPGVGDLVPTGGLGGGSFLNYLRSKYGL
jgi:hypothetical protein